MNNRYIVFFVGVLLLLCSTYTVKAQTEEEEYNYIVTAVPFLTITPDAISGGIGDAGAATSPNTYSQFWNPAKYSRMRTEKGVGLTYVPWLTNITSDIRLIYLTGYSKLGNGQGISASFRYFSYGSIDLKNEDGSPIGSSNPNEFALDFGYNLELSKRWSGAVSLRYLRSDLFTGAVEGYSAANGFAGDIAFYYTVDPYALEGPGYSFGVAITNLGSKISYNEGVTKEFLPANLKLGGSFLGKIDNTNKIGISIDMNKLLVPSTDVDLSSEEATEELENTSSIGGVIASFGDASGGIKEELREIGLSSGVEYSNNDMIFLRLGYRYEHVTKGNQNYLTLGAGVNWSDFGFDFSYTLPTANNNTLSNSMKFSINYGI